MHIALWIVQVVLALLYLWAGGYKLVAPIESMTADMPTMPGWFLRFIGLCEFLGGLGLILPGLLRRWTFLTPLAALGLVIIMIGATVITIALGGGAMTLMPFGALVLAAFVAYGRWRLDPLPSKT